MDAIISVIVPVYNVEEYLERCVDSILRQTYTNLEVILVDDGSTDNCPQICEQYASFDKRVRVIHQSNGGLFAARNAGIDAAKGEYLSFIDSDDFISEDMYTSLYGNLKKYDADIAACGMERIGENNESMGTWPSSAEFHVFYREDFIENFYPENRLLLAASVCNKLYKKRIFEKIRFPVGKIFEDSFITLSTFDQCRCIVLDSNPYYKYFQRDGSIMHCNYSEKNMQLIDLAYEQYSFMKQKGLKVQCEYSLEIVVNNYLKNLLAVCMQYHEYKNEIKPYRKKFNKLLSAVLINRKICKMKKIAVMSVYLSPILSNYICKRYFPECLFDFMQ